MARNSNGWIDFRCIEAEQPIGAFYVGVMDAQDLVEISHADVHRIRDRDVESFVASYATRDP